MRLTWFALSFLGLVHGAVAHPVVVSSDGCAPLPVHRPAADVAYQAGVDVHGHPVLPADLPGTVPVIDPTKVGVEIEVPLVEAAERLDETDFVFEGFDATAMIGIVTVDRDGVARLDGRVLAPPAVPPPGCRPRP